MANKKIYITEEQHNRVFKGAVNEYLDKNFAIPFKRTLNASDEEKAWMTFESHMYEVRDYLEEHGYLDELDEDSVNELDDIINEYDPIMLARFIKDNFGGDVVDDIYKEIEYQNAYPSTHYVMDYTKDIHNEWLIHFSDNASLIADEGFRYATENIEDVAYSNCGETDGKQSEGYDFAFVAEYANNSKAKYGREAVMFRASGVQATHFGDEEEQVVFYNNDAKDIVYIARSNGYTEDSRGEYICEDEWYVPSRINGDTLYHSDNIEDIVVWVERNFEQYRKHLVNSKESKVRKNKFDKSYYYGSRKNESKKHNSLVESMQNGFSLAKLDELSRNEYFDAVLDYAYKYLGNPIGKGSDRIVFEIGDDEVIKIENGCKQNEKEWNIVKTLEKSFPTLFPRVYQHASDFSWIVCERVLPFERVDCSAILGIPYSWEGIRKSDNKGNDYSNYIKPIRDDFSFQNEHGTEFDISLFGFMDWAQRVILKDITYKEEDFQFKNLMSKSEFLKELFGFMSSVGGSQDLYSENFGIAIREGKPKIVILDVGYEELTK